MHPTVESYIKLMVSQVVSSVSAPVNAMDMIWPGLILSRTSNIINFVVNMSH